MYDNQDRPPWLRNLRPPRPEGEPEPEPYVPAPVVPEPIFEPDVSETPTRARGGITRQQMLVLALLLWGNVGILGCLCLLATGTVLP